MMTKDLIQIKVYAPQQSSEGKCSDMVAKSFIMRSFFFDAPCIALLRPIGMGFVLPYSPVPGRLYRPMGRAGPGPSFFVLLFRWWDVKPVSLKLIVAGVLVLSLYTANTQPCKIVGHQLTPAHDRCSLLHHDP